MQRIISNNILLKRMMIIILFFYTGSAVAQVKDKSPGYTVACYYYPNYHTGSPSNARTYGAKWSEWEEVKKAKPFFKGHQQPLVPLLGYTNEADPKVMEKKISLAASYGIDAFIFDWYYYETGPNLEEALEQGYMKAKNVNDVKFAIMWTNDYLTPATFEKMTDYIIAKYFKHHAYWKIDGCPYFSVYDQSLLHKVFGTAEATKDALDRFRAKVKKAGFPDLHINVVLNGLPVKPGTTEGHNTAGFSAFLTINSLTSYVWVHNVSLNKFPVTPYAEVANEYFNTFCPAVSAQFGIIHYPNVTMGWDPSPRCKEAQLGKGKAYPCTSIMGDNTPAAFGNALVQAKNLIKDRPVAKRVFTINCWNEWTEGSHLEPDTRYKYQYLEQVRRVFGSR